MDLGTRKLPGSGETPRQVGKPPNDSGSHLRRNDGVFKQNEPQETLNSLFSYLESSVKDPLSR